MSRHVEISDTRLHVVERGGDGLPLLVVHGGPGLDHRLFGDYLDPLGDELHLVLVDLRSNGRSDKTPPETWTLERMAADLSELAEAMGFRRYATLGHSYGAFVALQHAVDRPAAGDDRVQRPPVGPLPERGGREPRRLRAGRAARAGHAVVGARGRGATQEDCARLLHDQLPFHFGDPRDPRIEEFERRTAGGVYAPEVLRHFAVADYGAIEVEDRLGDVTHPVLVLAGRHDRTCVVEGGEAIAGGIPGAQLTVFEASGHLTFAEENEAYLDAVRRFLQSVP